MIPSVHEDSRYLEASARLSAIQTERDDFRRRYEVARRRETGAKAGAVDEARRRLGLKAGTVVAPAEASDALLAELNIREEMLNLQQQHLNQLRAEISAETCRKLRAKHDALAGKVAAALHDVKAADKKLAEFHAALTNAGVQSTFPVLIFRPARHADFGSIDHWLAQFGN